jgi:hypothetical protein
MWRHPVGHTTEESCVAASSTLIASADRSGMTRLSRVGTLEPIGQLEAIGASEGVSGLVFAGDDLLLCITGFRTLAVCGGWTRFTLRGPPSRV